MNKVIIDGKNSSLGRLASFAAKQSLLGREVVILNCTDVMIFGRKVSILEDYKKTFFRKGGSLKTAKHIKRSPERIVKRTIRGMLSHKQTRGSEAHKRIMCYDSVPTQYSESKDIITYKATTKQGISLRDLTKLI